MNFAEFEAEVERLAEGRYYSVGIDKVKHSPTAKPIFHWKCWIYNVGRYATGPTAELALKELKEIMSPPDHSDQEVGVIEDPSEEEEGEDHTPVKTDYEVKCTKDDEYNDLHVVVEPANYSWTVKWDSGGCGSETIGSVKAPNYDIAQEQLHFFMTGNPHHDENVFLREDYR